MKKFAIAIAAFVAVLSILPPVNADQKSTVLNVNKYKIKNAIACTPDRAGLAALLANGEDIPPMPGSGSYVWKIAAKNDSAQFYFNQGINMYYGFHIIESLASFKKSAKFDPGNPMVWWAQALAYGPNINDIGYNSSPEALIATKKAMELSEKASPVEKALIRAMTVRYSDDSLKTREGLNQDYTDAMKEAYRKYPTAADIMVLYADAMMLQHPWDLWNINGSPQPWTPEIQKILEKSFTIAPMHPGANHYYIHVMEPSPYPQKALASANVLGKIAPGLAHLVHMPSHIYLRTGQYNKGAEINKEALKRFAEYSALFPAVWGNAFIYLLHNQHMLANCAMHAGRFNEAISAAHDLEGSIDSAALSTPPPMGSYVQYAYMSSTLINTRFEKWDSLLDAPEPDAKYVYANILYHFGRGMARAAKNDINEAKNEAEQMESLMTNEDLKIPMSPFSPAIDGAIVANEILNGSVSLKENKNDIAIKHFTKAAETEEKMVYNEPRDWILNPYQYLGSAYLASKNYLKAEQSFKKDLTKNAKNVWSLHGLEKALTKQNKKRPALSVKNEFIKASSRADIDFAEIFF